MTPAEALDKVVAAVEAEGKRLRAEFYAPQGPRGRRGSCPADKEIEERLQVALQALIPARFCGEECAIVPGSREGWTWLVDPHDGTFEFTSGRRGSAISVALLEKQKVVLAVVHAPDAPDRGPDTIAWAEGRPLLRNGKPMEANLGGKGRARDIISRRREPQMAIRLDSTPLPQPRIVISTQQTGLATFGNHPALHLSAFFADPVARR